MTHDMALRPRPLFMASHVSDDLLPWGAPHPTNLPQPSIGACAIPGSHTNENTIHYMNYDPPMT